MELNTGWLQPFDTLTKEPVLLTENTGTYTEQNLFNDPRSAILDPGGTEQLPDITDPAPTETPPPVNYGKLILIGAGVWIVFKIIQGK